MNFALITEGVTDQEVITSILHGYFDIDDIDITYLVPERDATDRKVISKGGWFFVLDYCQQKAFKEAFQFCDYIIVHIDTDASDDFQISKLKSTSSDRCSNKDLWDEVVSLFREKIGNDFFQKNRDQIIFAIAIDSIECWLLPLHITEKKKANKQQNCFNLLQKTLSKKNQKLNKDRRTYERISDPYSKNKTLMNHYKSNDSLKLFIEELVSKNIKI